MTTFPVQNIFGGCEQREGTLIEIVTRGFNTAGGGWSRYGGRSGDTPAKFAVIRWKRKRKRSAVAIERIGKMEKPLDDYIAK